MYRIKVEAKYKDFVPLYFSVEVKYLPNLDGKIKILDIGTHVFYKRSAPYMRPKTPYKFELMNVINSEKDDDTDNYKVWLNDSLK